MLINPIWFLFFSFHISNLPTIKAYDFNLPNSVRLNIKRSNVILLVPSLYLTLPQKPINKRKMIILHELCCNNILL